MVGPAMPDEHVAGHSSRVGPGATHCWSIDRALTAPAIRQVNRLSFEKGAVWRAAV